MKIENIMASQARSQALINKVSDRILSLNEKDDNSIGNKTSFSNFFQSAIQLINETNDLNKKADQMGIDFTLGKIDNISELMIAQEKASIALQYTVQLRNGFLDAYNEIMRMQV